MIIAISGAQGQGKSTTISELKKHGYKSIENKVSRSILSEWNITLGEVNRSLDIKKSFQEEVLKRQILNDEPVLNSKEIYFSERSYADIFVYALMAFGPFNQYDNWLNDYYIKCKQNQVNYKKVIFLSGRSYIPENDGVRSVNIHFANSVGMLICNYMKDFDTNNSSIIIKNKRLKMRVRRIIENIGD